MDRLLESYCQEWNYFTVIHINLWSHSLLRAFYVLSLHIVSIVWNGLWLHLRLSCCIPLERGGMYRLSPFPSLSATFYNILLRGICTPNVYFLLCFSAWRSCLISIGIKLNYSKSTTLCSTTSIQNPTNPAHESSIKVKTFLNVLKCLFLIKIIL